VSPTRGKILLVHGASSAGKSTLCKALQNALPEPFWHYSIDHLRDSGVLPRARFRCGDFRWAEHRAAFFTGFHHSVVAFAEAGNNLIVEHIIETAAMKESLVRLFSPFDVYFVAVHCPLDELERREKARGDRPLGDARRDFATVHTFGPFDDEVDATRPLSENVAQVLSGWQARSALAQRAFTAPPAS